VQRPAQGERRSRPRSGRAGAGRGRAATDPAPTVAAYRRTSAQPACDRRAKRVA
jgi:hypothetical protein